MTARSVPVNDFAVVRDVERDVIVGSGNYSYCVNQAESFNRVYQSSAYVAELWKERREQ